MFFFFSRFLKPCYFHAGTFSLESRDHYTRLAACISNVSISATTELIVGEDWQSLSTFSWAALGCLLPGIICVALGLMLRKSSEISNED